MHSAASISYNAQCFDNLSYGMDKYKEIINVMQEHYKELRELLLKNAKLVTFS